MRHGLIAALLLAASVAGCSDADEPAAPPVAAQTGPDLQEPLTGIYIARTEKPLLGPDGEPAPARLALFHGSYNLKGGCLVFDMGGDEPALVRFNPDTKIEIYEDRVIIDGSEHSYGVEEQRGGGFDGDDAYDLLLSPPPDTCRYSVIGP